MTIQPSPAIEWPAEQRPLPDGWCYRCGGEHHPASVRHAIRAAQEAPLPVELSDWHAGHVALARAVAVELQLWADTAERLSRL